MNKTNSLRCLSIEFRFETMFPCSILFFTETSKSEILSRGIADTSILLSCPLVSFDSHFFFFLLFIAAEFYSGHDERAQPGQQRLIYDFYLRTSVSFGTGGMAKQETRARVIIVSCSCTAVNTEKG